MTTFKGKTCFSGLHGGFDIHRVLGKTAHEYLGRTVRTAHIVFNANAPYVDFLIKPSRKPWRGRDRIFVACRIV
jgi:hypothetical protein